jgi:hypothetical protein
LFQVHNTFGESHVYVLEANKSSNDAAKGTSFQYRWTFPRAFHVSPFNDRKGFYVVSATAPESIADMSSSSRAPLPDVRVDLYTPSVETGQPDRLKLRARLKAVNSRPLTTSNLLSALARAPFTLLLSFARIAKEAWFLHYGSPRLDVYIRPEPVLNDKGGTRWQPESMLERHFRGVVEEFIEERLRSLDIIVKIVPPDPLSSPSIFLPGSRSQTAILTITYQSAEMFTILVTTPSAAHALILSQGVFQVSDETLFLKVFAVPETTHPHSLSFSQRLRTKTVPLRITLPIPARHFADSWTSVVTLSIVISIGKIERYLFYVVKARPVAGDEPWMKWERGFGLSKAARSELGSVQHD